MSKENQKLSYDELVQELTQLCNVDSTGTMFIVTDSGHSARISMKDGHIGCFAYRTHKGLDAILEMFEIQSGKYHFSSGIYNPYNHLELPDTPTLLQQFKLREFPQAVNTLNTEIPVIETSANARPAEVAKTGPAMSSEKVVKLIDSIESNLLDFLGPFADIAMHDYLSSYHRPESRADFKKMIATLAGEIDDAAEQQKFKNNCIKILRQ